MLWLALHLPALSLESFAATLDAAGAGRPLALLEGTQLSAVDATARALGVQPGLKRSTALALAPQLLLGQADAARDAQALRAVAHGALAFTPSVSLHGSATVLLEVQPSLRFFGGAASLLQRLMDAVQPLGHALRVAGAPTALGAAVLAQWAPPRLAPLSPQATDPAALKRLLDDAPVWLLGPGRIHWEALQGMGLRTLADLRALPRAGLARRFGEPLLLELDRARGDAPDPRTWVELPGRFESRLELVARADTAEQLLHGAQVLLARLVAWAAARQGRVGRFTLAMQHEARHRADDRTPRQTTLDIALAEASNDAAHLGTLLRERLGRLPLPAPTLELRLHCEALVAGAAPNTELFPTRATEHEGLTRLLERLQARLGAASVQRLQRVADHRPECGTRLLPVEAPAVPGPLADTPPHLTRPIWLLAVPQPLRETSARPLLDGRPLQLLAGPERIEAGWWDGTPAARDYFVAQADDGALVWVYRTRLPPAAGDAGWYLHGRFA